MLGRPEVRASQAQNTKAKTNSREIKKHVLENKVPSMRWPVADCSHIIE